MIRDEDRPPPSPQQTRPPDAAAAAAALLRSRARRSKNGAKKQPQRGLGVAQLEKLRLEEQSKQEAACLASLHRHHRLSASPLSSDALVLVAGEQSQTLPLHPYLSRYTKGGGGGGGLHVISAAAACNRGNRNTGVHPMMCVRDQTLFPVIREFDDGEHQRRSRNLPVTNLNTGNATRSFPVVPSMSSVAPGCNLDRSLPFGMANVQHETDENEACLSSMSPPHDLHSSKLAISSTAIALSEQSVSKMSPHSDAGKTFTINECSLQAINTHPDYPIFITKALTGKSPPAAWPMRFHETGSKSEVLWGKSKEAPAFFSVTAVSKEKVGKDIIAGQQQDAEQNRMSPLPFTDLRLFQPIPGSKISLNQPRNHQESPEAMELSSFQTFPSNQAWSLGDQISGRKRQWVLTQEPTRNFEELKGTYIHMPEEDMLEPKLHDDPDTGLLGGSDAANVAGIYRNSAGNVTVSSVKATSSFPTTVKEHTENLLSLSGFSSEFVSFAETMPLKVCTVPSSRQMDYFTSAASNGSSLPDTRTQPMDFVVSSKNIEARISNDFLSLGLSTSSPSMPEEPTVRTGHGCRFSPTSDADKTRDNLRRSPTCTQQGERLGKFLCMLPTTAPNSPDKHEQHYYYRGPSSIPLSTGLPSLVCGSENEQMERQPSPTGKNTVDLELKLCL